MSDNKDDNKQTFIMVRPCGCVCEAMVDCEDTRHMLTEFYTEAAADSLDIRRVSLTEFRSLLWECAVCKPVPVIGDLFEEA